MKVYLRPFQRIVRLYRDSNLRRDEMKDDSEPCKNFTELNQVTEIQNITHFTRVFIFM